MKSLKKIVFAIMGTALVINVSAQTKDTTKTTISAVPTTSTFISSAYPVPVTKPKVINRIGLKSSFNLASAKFVNDDIPENQFINDEMKAVPRASVMFLWENGHSEYFVTQVGLGYTGKGYKALSGTLTMHYIEVPIIWNFRLPIAGPVYIMGGFGPYFSFAFNGKEKRTDFATGEQITLNDILEYTPGKDAVNNKAYNPFDAGLIFGGTVEVQLPEGKIIEVGAHYQVGVQKISNKWSMGGDPEVFDNPGIKNSILSISVSFLFDLNKEKKAKK